MKNDMEILVREELQRHRESAPAAPHECRCDLCTADVVALALNQLPTHYCQTQSYGCTKIRRLRARVSEAVRRASERVALRPHHPPGDPTAGALDVHLGNFAHTIGESLAETAPPDGCGCPQCRSDALAIALNHYPPKYGVSCPGRPSRQEHFVEFIRHEIGLLLALAFRVVKRHPHH